jgi:hypothetical protein
LQAVGEEESFDDADILGRAKGVFGGGESGGFLVVAFLVRGLFGGLDGNLFPGFFLIIVVAGLEPLGKGIILTPAFGEVARKGHTLVTCNERSIPWRNENLWLEAETQLRTQMARAAQTQPVSRLS